MPDKAKPATATAYIGDSARHYDKLRFTTAAGRAIDAAERDRLISTLQQLATGSKVLEVGCGTGRLLFTSCELGFSCDGLDASPDMIEQTHERIKQRFPETGLHVGDATQLPFAADSYDFTYSIRLLNQTGSARNALAVITEMLRVTRPGGLALVEFVNHYRPRLSGKSANNVYLRPRDVIRAGRLAGGVPVSLHGKFFFGMTAQHYAPSILRPLLNKVDGILCRITPRLCARCYVLFAKAAQ